MIRFLHLLLVAAYISLPAVMLLRGILPSVRTGQRGELRRVWFACFAGLLASVVVCVVYALGMHGRVLVGQLLLTAYFATSMLLLLRGFDHILWMMVTWLLRLRPGAPPSWSLGLRAGAALIVRAAILFGVGLPYVLATVMTYRPRVGLLDTPASLYKWPYESVSFPATDGTRLAAWWIPATGGESSQTVVLCPGLSASKATQLHLARQLVPGGYNVLALDLRAHGESGGQLVGFGDLERRDVLGAVRWLRANHPDACRKLLGLGASTGGAALLAAAVDPGPDGQAIDAIAVYASFDRLGAVTHDICASYLPRSLGWSVEHIGLPLAGVQVGTDLSAFAPADAARQLWPRPILVIHGLADEIVRFERGEALYDAAFQPKYNDWIERAGHDEVMSSRPVEQEVKRYFDTAARVL